MDASVRVALNAVLRPEDEITELLGPGRGNVRSCWNKAVHVHGDKSPSLGYNPKTGGWRCFAGNCQEKGDILTLYMRVKGWTFPETMEYLLKKYGIQPSERAPKAGNKGSKFKILTDDKDKQKVTGASNAWTPERLEFMYERYGIDAATLKKYNIGWDQQQNRVLIPVYVDKIGGKLVNIRRHDCFRAHCRWYHKINEGTISESRPPEISYKQLAQQDYGDWYPKWDKQYQGKVLSVAGHGGPYIYPLNVIVDAPLVYVVGGELKAILLNMLGIPAVCFTGGEGQYAEELLHLFLGKQVRVLYDVDKAGIDATFGRAPGTKGPTDRGIMGAAQVLADSGAYVEAGRWPAEIVAALPEKGDITDYLKACSWKAEEALTFIQWEKVERKDTENVENIKAIRTTEPQWDDLKSIKFNGLVEPANLDKWVKVQGLISGRGDTPFVVPRRVEATCPSGQAAVQPLCKECRLPSCSFKAKMEFAIKDQLELVGIPSREIDGVVKKYLGIPVKCEKPDLEIQNSSVETILLTPTVDYDEGSSTDTEEEFEFAHRGAYLLQDTRIDCRENTTYEFGGIMLRDPRNSKYSFAIREFKAAAGDILHYTPNPPVDEELRRLFHDKDPQETIWRMIGDLRDHVCHIYGSDEMLLAILISFFLPFRFKLGDYSNERICPSVKILGDTTVGKSTVTKAFIRHFGAGRFQSMDSHPTFAGLIGGSIPVGNRMAFSWGALPTSNGAFVGLDEFYKLPVEDIGSLTNTLSSGVAERVTANGNRRTLCHVRMLYLTNPRGSKSLKSVDPFEAALAGMGTVQDLGRIEYLHVQHEVKDLTIFSKRQVAQTQHLYRKELARQHLSWAWSLNKDRIRFVNPDRVLDAASHLSAKYGSNTLLLPAMARFKLARFAAGFATLLYSTDGYNLVVRDEHLQLAYDFYDRNYSTFLKAHHSGSYLPEQVTSFLATISKPRNLRVLIAAEDFSREDLNMAMDAMAVTRFLEVFQLEQGLITSVSRGRYRFREEHTKEQLALYITNRLDQQRA